MSRPIQGLSLAVRPERRFYVCQPSSLAPFVPELLCLDLPVLLDVNVLVRFESVGPVGGKVNTTGW